MPAIFLRELYSETIPPGLLWVSDSDGSEEAAKCPPSQQPALLPVTGKRVRAKCVAKGLLAGCAIGMAPLGTPELTRPSTLPEVAASSSFPHCIHCREVKAPSRVPAAAPTAQMQELFVIT